MKTILNAFLMMLISTLALAQSPKTVLISDIDDTLKVGYTFGLLKGVQFFRDTQLRFTGMSELYRSLEKDQPGLVTFYVSVAPQFLMKNTHQAFLKNGNFPAGTYIGRSHFTSDQHKLETIRAILRQEKPEQAILVGDDGQIDATVYNEISQDAEFSQTKFFQFIHVVSSEADENGEEKVSVNQVGYLTAVELAVEMGQQGLLKPESVESLMKTVLPKILQEGELSNYKEVEFSFPYFINCRSLNWKWNIPGLNERVQNFCHLK